MSSRPASMRAAEDSSRSGQPVSGVLLASREGAFARARARSRSSAPLSRVGDIGNEFLISGGLRLGSDRARPPVSSSLPEPRGSSTLHHRVPRPPDGRARPMLRFRRLITQSPRPLRLPARSGRPRDRGDDAGRRRLVVSQRPLSRCTGPCHSYSA